MAGALRDDETFMFDRAAETMARDELDALQLRRLKQTIARAYTKVPPFRHKLDAAGVRPDDLKTLADIARFPFTVKADLRDNFPFGLFAMPREKLLRLHASSGTTGKPTVVGYSKGDLDTWSDLMARSMACGGARRRDRAPGRAAQGFRRQRAVRHAVLRDQHRRGRGRHGRRPARPVAAGRPVRRRAVERRHAPGPAGAA